MSRIVIVEDEFFAATHLSNLVVSFGYKVLGVYHSGEDFFNETDWEFDAAIVDLFLSEKLTGLDVAKVLNEKGKDFIFLTANQDAETLRLALKLSPSAYLSKPFQSNDVAAALTLLSLKKENHQSDPFFIFLKENAYTTEPLTLREVEILKVVMEGLSNNEIKAAHSISLSTIKSHTRKIYQKFETINRIELKAKLSTVFK
jgi:DNA-binding NarL/FixJ family response regulator